MTLTPRALVTLAPAGALSSAFDGSHDTSTSTKYIYSETSGTLGSELIVCRTPGFSPAQIRTGQNTSLNLRFWLHGYGDSIDTLSVYVDDASTSNETNALLYATYTASHSGAANTGTTTLTAVAGAQHTGVTPTTYTYSNQSNSPWIQSTINLYAIRNENTLHYIYFVMVAKPGISNHRFRGDLGIDQVEIVEVCNAKNSVLHLHGTSYCVEDDMTTEIGQYKSCDLPPDDPEVGDTSAGTYDESANTFTFDSPGDSVVSKTLYLLHVQEH